MLSPEELAELSKQEAAFDRTWPHFAVAVQGVIAANAGPYASHVLTACCVEALSGLKGGERDAAINALRLAWDPEPS
jgi:hypothetical protein